MPSVEAAAVNELSPVYGHLIPGWSIPILGGKREGGGEGEGGRELGRGREGEREGGRREGRGEGGRWGVERRKTRNEEVKYRSHYSRGTTLVLTGPCGLLGYVEEVAMNFAL